MASADGDGLPSPLREVEQESMEEFVKQFQRNMAQEVELDCHTVRFDGTFMKVKMNLGGVSSISGKICQNWCLVC